MLLAKNMMILAIHVRTGQYQRTDGEWVAGAQGFFFHAYPIKFSNQGRALLTVAVAFTGAMTEVEARMDKLEDRLSEWDALTRVRVKGCSALLAQAKELQASSREFWKLKDAAGRLIWAEISTRLSKGVAPDLLVQYESEFHACMASEGLTGVFPVGGTWSDCSIVDVRVKTGLQALRLNQLIKGTIAPKLKAIEKSDSFGIWVPMSQGEMKRRKRKQSTEAAVGADTRPRKSRARSPRRGRSRQGRRN